ncbi:hypothetical protein R3P38DRAFT_3354072 [Favolaschia claudopus]|uniref:GATA-type domain-containing protein n=1 Tax=Favolaschia claudopus TaxID=2862362 RepID=A0AAW0BPM5_9AGAR
MNLLTSHDYLLPTTILGAMSTADHGHLSTAEYLDDIHAKYEAEKAFYEKKYQKIQARPSNLKAKRRKEARNDSGTRTAVANDGSNAVDTDNDHEEIQTTVDDIDTTEAEANEQRGTSLAESSSTPPSEQNVVTVKDSEIIDEFIIPPEFPARVLRPRFRVHQFVSMNPTPSAANPPNRSLSPLSSVPDDSDSDSESESNPKAGSSGGRSRCPNCHTKPSAGGWRPSPLQPGRNICRSCYQYERRNAKPRPVPLEVRRRLQASVSARKPLPLARSVPAASASMLRATAKVTASPPKAKATSSSSKHTSTSSRDTPVYCYNCEVPTNDRHRYHSHLRLGEWVCQPCHKYELSYNIPRPRSMIERAEEMRVKQGIFWVTKSAALAAQNAGRKHAVS